MRHEEQARVGWVRLDVPAPPQLAELIGYRGSARWVAFHWEPCGDESFYDDGRSSGTGSPWPYLAFVRHRAVAAQLAPYNLGSSDSEATARLILDRAERRLYVAPARSARRVLIDQHPPLPELTPAQYGAVGERFDALTTEWCEWPVCVTPEDMKRAMREEQEGIARMVAFLDGWVQ